MAGNEHDLGNIDVVGFVRDGRSSARAIRELIVAHELDLGGLQSQLGSGELIRRLLAIARMCAALARGPNPRAALLLASPLWDALEAGLAEEIEAGVPDENIAHSLAISISSAAIAAGDADTAIRIADRVHGRFDHALPEIEQNAVRGLVQRFRLADARERYAGIPPSPELDRLLNDWRPISRPADALKPLPLDTRSREERLDDAAREAARRWVPDQRGVQEEWKAAMSLESRSSEEVAEFERAYEEMTAAIDLVEEKVANGNAARANEIFQRQVYLYASAGRRLSRLLPTEEGNHHQARNAINYAASVLSDAERSEEALRRAADDLLSAVRWYDERGSLAGASEANWALGLVYEALDDGPRSLACFRKVFEAVVSAAADLDDPAARAAAIRSYPNLYRRIVRLGLRTGETMLALDASETLRGTSFLQIGSRPQATAITARSDWHYLSIFVDDEGCVVFLRLQDGSLYVHDPGIGREELDDLTSRVRPRDWVRSAIRDAGSPRERLSTLMLPIRQALEDGRLQRGAHLATALDYPLNLIPLHYLNISGRAAVHDFSFSRVASLVDAMRIAEAPEGRSIKSVCLLAIPASDDRDRDMHLRNADAAVAPLVSRLLHRHVSEADTTIPEVSRALRSADVVHIQAHGFFPVASPAETVDPMRQAGLLTAAGGSWPDRSRPEEYLMTGEDILAGGVCDARHVAVAACVSGVGRPGHAGDILGLEFALRSIGVDSVTASHWHVEHEIASAFHAGFYRYWIGEGMTRADAWRSVTLDLVNANGPEERGWAKACAFSLHGNWSS